MSGQEPNWDLKLWSQQNQWLRVAVLGLLSHSILSPSIHILVYSLLAGLLFHRGSHGLPLEFAIELILADGWA